MRPFLLFRDSPPGRPSRWLDFGTPRRVLEAWRLDEVLPQLAAVEAAVAAGEWAIGFLAYEAAPAFDRDLVAHPPLPDWPLAFWAITAPPVEVELPGAGPLPAKKWRPRLGEQEHAAAVTEIRAAIARGETYQANFTFQLEAGGEGDPFPLFQGLVAAQDGRHAAFLDLRAGRVGRAGAELAVLSASPELFFRREGEDVVVRPMKGTARRGSPAMEAAALAELQSEKNRAENLMIVDMMRNDLGKVARPGSVRVSALFESEAYPTVYQLVSEVRAQTAVSQLELLRALFPCASITGAPKAATQALLRRLEKEPRGVYTGAIGYLAPGRRAAFAVGIRTVTWQRTKAQVAAGEPALLRFGTGGGIVWDSDAAAEYRECQTKASILYGQSGVACETEPMALFETLLYRPRSGFFLLERHLDRLLASAAHFGFPARRQDLRARLEAEAALFPADRCRVRLCLQADGTVEVKATPFPCEGPRPDLLLAVDDRPVVAGDPFLRHKTTWRRRYDEALARHPAAGEVALFNERGELTETTRGNLVLRFAHELLTPAAACGLLPGTYRAELLARGRLREAVLPLATLAEADEIFHLSALRGWWRCRLQG